MTAGAISDGEARNICLDLFRAGVEAADPGVAVLRSIEAARLLEPLGRRVIIAVGKAAVPMARAAMAELPHDQVLVVTNYENGCDLPGAEVLTAAHPVPDQSGAAAAQKVLDMAQSLTEADQLVMLISGGSSALLPAPAEGLSLADKIAMNQLMLASGLCINRTNLVRQALSRIKGGGLSRAAHPARVVAMILSDVIGDNLRVVASGPTVARLGSNAEARAIMQEAGVWDKAPGAVRQLLMTEPAPSPIPHVENRLIGGNFASVMAMKRAYPSARVEEEPLVGDVGEAAERVARAMARGPGVTLFGGETTVRLKGDGMGGRNQEMALRVAMLANGKNRPYAFLSGGTDGRDGPTDAAGGLVDNGTLDRIRAAGLDPADVLARNDSYHGLKAAGDLVVTGATGTNVADLQVLVVS